MKLARLVNWEPDPRRQTMLVAAGVAATALIGFVHYASGPKYEFHIFYLLPVIAVSWHVGLRAGIGIALLSVLNWLVMEWLTFDDDAATVLFNEVVRLAVLLVVSYLAARLRAVLRRESSFARIDPLTGLANRRLFHEQGDAELSRMRRHRYPLTVAFIDLDNFKTVNDTLGHAAGDALLKAAANTLRLDTRAVDTVGRLGGDEFAVLMPELAREAASARAVQMQQRLLACMTEHAWPVTVSVGVVTCLVPPPGFEVLIDRADALMYEVKRDGKNNIRHDVMAA